MFRDSCCSACSQGMRGFREDAPTPGPDEMVVCDDDPPAPGAYPGETPPLFSSVAKIAGTAVVFWGATRILDAIFGGRP